MKFFLFICYVNIFSISKSLNGRNNKNFKMIGKTVYVEYPKDWKELAIESTSQIVKADVTQTIPMTIVKDASITPTRTADCNNSNWEKISVTSTEFIDKRLSKEFLRLWRRTHRGLHWLPPKPTP
jgi:hypothetical protein